MRDWYLPPQTAEQQPAPGQHKTHWRDILTHWALIECDLQDMGIDVESGILHQRTWRWLNLRILDLINRPTRLRTALGLTAETVKQ